VQEQGFFETIDLFGRATRASNFLLDNWWLLPVSLILFWFYRRVRNEHALLGALDERASAAFADIDALLAERHILIANLAETVKGFAVQESTVMREVMEARAKAMANVGAARFDAENQIGMSLNSLFQLTENYPELASSSHFQGLRSEMTRIEERVTAARRFYNLAVEEFNSLRRAFPGNAIASFTKTEDYEKFNLGAERNQIAAPVRVSFAS
jgi:LemA protein